MQKNYYYIYEVTATSVYIKNQTTETLEGSTPYEKWYSKKLSVMHLRIFENDCYAHIPKDQRSKLEINLKKYLMIDYNKGNKIYQSLDSITKKCYIRRNIIFNKKPRCKSV